VSPSLFSEIGRAMLTVWRALRYCAVEFKVTVVQKENFMSLDYVSNQRSSRRRSAICRRCMGYLTAAPESETTCRQARLGFDSLGCGTCAHRRLQVDTSEVLGQKLRIPVMAPIGSLQTITPRGASAVAKAAADSGSMNSLALYPAESWKRSRPARTIRIFHSISGGLDWCAEIVGRVKRLATSHSA